jgi:regulator of protease activity HflC (stomatin/prohibitin superfamily)
MAALILVIGLVVTFAILAGSARLHNKRLRPPAAAGAGLVLAAVILASSVRHIGADGVGIVVKNIGARSLKGGAYIAVDGEQGIQADVLAPGWHFWYWPFVYDVREAALTDVPQGKVGLIDATDGQPLPAGQVIAPEFAPGQLQEMLDARVFLTIGKGCKGTQASVLTPGKYRLNTELFKVTVVDQTVVDAGEVAVLTSNSGQAPTLMVQGAAGAMETGPDGKPLSDQGRIRLAAPGEMGVLAAVLPPGGYALNTQAFTVKEIWTTQMIAHYASGEAGNPVYSKETGSIGHSPAADDQEIRVITSDGFQFPVDVRVEYFIEPANAPIVVAKLGDDEGPRFRNALNSAVRAIFRNNAEHVRALDYVQQRSEQESQSLAMLREQMTRFGVTVTAVRIGNVGDEKTLGALLKTQMDREIAKQEQLTFQEQQKAAEQKKELSRVTQESDEEKRLATASYSAKIAEEERKRKVTEANAEAESTTIKAKAQADAYRLIADQIGRTNAALVEILKVVGEKGIVIAPRVMVTGGAGAASGSPALVGTMLDSMIDRQEGVK